MIKINNRRYIGSKASLVTSIYEEVNKRIDGNYVFADIFAGTGVVAYKFAESGHKVIVNDNLFSNYISYNAWFGDSKVDKNKLNKLVNKYNDINFDDIEENYFSKVYGGKYYSVNVAKKIGHIRDLIEKEKPNLTYREYSILLTSLMYAADKIANTVGHFEHFLKKQPIDIDFSLQKLDIMNSIQADVYQEDANNLVKKIKADVVYIDPPYNARQYVNFYHVLENLITWEKPTVFEGSSMKFKRDHLKSGYSRSKAKELLEDLVNSINAKIIVISYNNTYNAKSTASNNKISEHEIIDILTKKGSLEILDVDYKYFNTGKTKFNNHKELLYICKVK